MKAYLINSKTEEHGPVDAEPTLEEYYRLVGCRCVDFIIRKIAGRPYAFIVDDEGMLKESNRTSAASLFGRLEQLFGNVLIFGSDPRNEEHGMRSLTDDDLGRISSSMFVGAFPDGSTHPVLSYTL